jgi:hypothetical protein
MENISVLNDAGIISDKTIIVQRRTGFNPAIITLISEGGLNFFRYLKSIGMSGKSELTVLSSKHDYYYDDDDDFKSVRILINLKKLNLIKHLDMFLKTLIRILPPEANFIGYFSSNNTVNSEGSGINWYSRFFKRSLAFPFPANNNSMNKNEIKELLERNGFRTIDMKEINGNIYFYSRTVFHHV